MKYAWTPDSWRKKPITQKYEHPDLHKLAEVEARLSTYPPLVFAGEARRLKYWLSQVCDGKAFLLQGGDCAESFNDFRAKTIRDNFRILLQVATILTFGTKLPVIKVGRVAGQFAKPRSNEFENQGGELLPAYRGDLINGFEYNIESRTPDPTRMERAYFQAASTLNLLRAFAQGGYADLHQVHAWNLEFLKKSSQNVLYESVAQRLDEALAFMVAMGVTSDNHPRIRETEFYTSHEALVLNYEEALTRRDSTTAREAPLYLGDWYDCSAHLLWIGARTAQPDGAHVEFLRGVGNPIGLKCDPTLSPDDLCCLMDILNPLNEKGRLTLITRMGRSLVAKGLPLLIRRVKAEGRNVVWCCDPMHGNTVTSRSGYKTRDFSDILSEVHQYLSIHQTEGTYPGGVHLEMTGKDVVECIGGGQLIREEHLAGGHYETLCDPRLNASQAIELAFQLAQPLEPVRVRPHRSEQVEDRTNPLEDIELSTSVLKRGETRTSNPIETHT